MKTSNLLFIALCLSTIFSSCSNAQDFQHPETIIQTVDGYQLKEKHLYAYLDKNAGSFGISAILDDPETITSLRKQLLEEFSSMPEMMVLELEDHYEWLQAQGGGTSTVVSETNVAPQTAPGQQTDRSGFSVLKGSESDQWNQILMGSVLVFQTSQHHGGMYVQSTQYVHLCPGGSLQIYESSAGGGSAAGMSISGSDQLRLSAVGQWDVIVQEGISYFRMSQNGEVAATVIKVVNNQIYLQGVGALKYVPGAAQCI